MREEVTVNGWTPRGYRDDWPARHRNCRDSGELHAQFTVLEATTGREVVTVRAYWPGVVVYAIAWLHGSAYDDQSVGFGSAGGYGYHMLSAAIEDALRDAGVEFSAHWGGAGDYVMREAIEATARKISTKRRFYIVEAHA